MHILQTLLICAAVIQALADLPSRHVTTESDVEIRSKSTGGSYFMFPRVPACDPKNKQCIQCPTTKFTKGKRGLKKGMSSNKHTSSRGKPKAATPQPVNAKKVNKANGAANANAKSKPKPKRSNNELMEKHSDARKMRSRSRYLAGRMGKSSLARSVFPRVDFPEDQVNANGPWEEGDQITILNSQKCLSIVVLERNRYQTLNLKPQDPNDKTPSFEYVKNFLIGHGVLDARTIKPKKAFAYLVVPTAIRQSSNSLYTTAFEQVALTVMECKPIELKTGRPQNVRITNSGGNAFNFQHEILGGTAS
ncbi:unnamed protein product [Clonostachys solani]|uniref:Uncharacterized protein n=1 Tax=Clonostachys solani TaxID=160281 RepID=A0A9N9YWZ1_9HYPO|nr:unnamed protein product [Clonostachys solani]